MIEYVEIRNQNFDFIGIVDVFNSIIWHVEYYGVGDFEIYAPCSALNLELLTAGHLITRTDDENVGIIENVEYSFSMQNGRMIKATGRFAKSLLSRRIIYRMTGTNTVSTTILSGNVETAVRNVIEENAIDCPFDAGRNMQNLILGEHSGSTAVIIDAAGNPTEQQTAFDNLLTWSNEFLQNYKIGSAVRMNNGKFEFYCFEGKNRAVGNLDGNEPVIFSQAFENLISSDFKHDETNYKNAALIGGEGDGIARFCAVLIPSFSGVDRREIFIDGSKTAKKYVDDAGHEQTLTDSQYNAQLIAIGAQKLATLPILQTFNGEINLNSLTFKYKTNYNIGDIITVQDSDTKIFINTRIIEIIEVQDEKGYSISGKYES